MRCSFFVLLISSNWTWALPSPIPVSPRGFPRTGFKLGGFTPPAFRPPSPDIVSSHYVSLQRTSGSLSHDYIRALWQGTQSDGVFGLEPVSGDDYSTSFVAPIEFGTKMFQVIVDTGSSDTWLAELGFECVDVETKEPVPESECAFGPLYNKSSTFKKIPDENFNIEYGDGEFLTGILGTEHVTLAGITVKNQEVSTVNHAGWYGDGVVSGLLGLASPSLTRAYAGNDVSGDTEATQIQYSPIFTNMYTEGHVAPMFSLAINRGNIPGILAFGGLAPVPWVGPFASAPFQVITINGVTGPTSGKPQYSFYVIDLDAIVYTGSHQTAFSTGTWPSPLRKPTNPSHIQAIVDSGTTLNYFPTEIASAINALFVPPAEYDTPGGVYVVDCEATAPKVGVTIGGQTFYMNAQDLILDVGFGNGECLSGIIDGRQGPYILGDVFLKNVMAVFDVGAGEMRFTAREYY